MFGSTYAKHPEVLMRSFQGMKESYRKVYIPSKKSMMQILQIWYLRMFGVPEIGFQLRALHFAKALKKISLKRTASVLDAGSGIGCYTLEFARQHPKSIVEGWDLDKNDVAASRLISRERNISNAIFSVRNLTRVPQKKKKYDFIFTIDVLEHIRAYKNVLGHFHTLLKSGGYLYIHVPQIHQKRFFKCFETWSHEEHFREGFPQLEMKKDLQRAGFQIVDSWNTFGAFGSLSWELNHLLLSKSFILAGISFPFLYVLAIIDTYILNRKGLAAVYIVKKP